MKNIVTGIPTDIEVRKLRETFSTEQMVPGFKVSHKEVEDTIGVEYGTNRYRAVTGRWRKLMEREHNIIIGPDVPVGFVVLDDPGKVAMAHGKLRTSAKMARRSIVVASRVNPKNLNDDQLKQYAHCEKVSAAMMLAAKIKPSAELPQI